jgi:hypothetical protein
VPGAGGIPHLSGERAAVIEPLMDARLRQLRTPRRGEDFDAWAFVAVQGSLYLVVGLHRAAQAAPLLTALVEYWLTTAQEMALGYPHRRVDPPVTTVLDELTDLVEASWSADTQPARPLADHPRDQYPHWASVTTTRPANSHTACPGLSPAPTDQPDRSSNKCSTHTLHRSPLAAPVT